MRISAAISVRFRTGTNHRSVSSGRAVLDRLYLEHGSQECALHRVALLVHVDLHAMCDRQVMEGIVEREST